MELTLPSKESAPRGRFRRSLLPKIAIFCGTWCLRPRGSRGAACLVRRLRLHCTTRGCQTRARGAELARGTHLQTSTAAVAQTCVLFKKDFRSIFVLTSRQTLRGILPWRDTQFLSDIVQVPRTIERPRDTSTRGILKATGPGSLDGAGTDHRDHVERDIGHEDVHVEEQRERHEPAISTDFNALTEDSARLRKPSPPQPSQCARAHIPRDCAMMPAHA